MSARHIPSLTPAVFDQLATDEISRLQSLNQEMTENLKVIEQDVREAKTLVRQTQSKVDELAVSIDKIKEPQTER
jgi:peptidoglycan hydrolase CwlO-like protein